MLLLAPGAGAGRDQPALVAIDEAATAAGAHAERMDFPYRLAGRRAPDKAPVLMDAVRRAATALLAPTDPVGARIVLGGRSMGGRICSMVVAEGMTAAGLILVSYPLHPPGHPEKSRSGHFARIEVPCLFVSGTRDAFGTPDELTEATGLIAGPVTVQFIEGKDHAMRGADAQVATIAVDWMLEQAML